MQEWMERLWKDMFLSEMACVGPDRDVQSASVSNCRTRSNPKIKALSWKTHGSAMANADQFETKRALFQRILRSVPICFGMFWESVYSV